MKTTLIVITTLVVVCAEYHEFDTTKIALFRFGSADKCTIQNGINSDSTKTGSSDPSYFGRNLGYDLDTRQMDVNNRVSQIDWTPILDKYFTTLETSCKNDTSSKSYVRGESRTQLKYLAFTPTEIINKDVNVLIPGTMMNLSLNNVLEINSVTPPKNVSDFKTRYEGFQKHVHKNPYHVTPEFQTAYDSVYNTLISEQQSQLTIFEKMQITKIVTLHSSNVHDNFALLSLHNPFNKSSSGFSPNNAYTGGKKKMVCLKYDSKPMQHSLTCVSKSCALEVHDSCTTRTDVKSLHCFILDIPNIVRKILTNLDSSKKLFREAFTKPMFTDKKTAEYFLEILLKFGELGFHVTHQDNFINKHMYRQLIKDTKDITKLEEINHKFEFTSKLFSAHPDLFKGCEFGSISNSLDILKKIGSGDSDTTTKHSSWFQGSTNNLNPESLKEFFCPIGVLEYMVSEFNDNANYKSVQTQLPNFTPNNQFILEVLKFISDSRFSEYLSITDYFLREESELNYHLQGFLERQFFGTSDVNNFTVSKVLTKRMNVYDVAIQMSQLKMSEFSGYPETLNSDDFQNIMVNTNESFSSLLQTSFKNYNNHTVCEKLYQKSRPSNVFETKYVTDFLKELELALKSSEIICNNPQQLFQYKFNEFLWNILKIKNLEYFTNTTLGEHVNPWKNHPWNSNWKLFNLEQFGYTSTPTWVSIYTFISIDCRISSSINKIQKRDIHNDDISEGHDDESVRCIINSDKHSDVISKKCKQHSMEMYNNNLKIKLDNRKLRLKRNTKDDELENTKSTLKKKDSRIIIFSKDGKDNHNGNDILTKLQASIDKLVSNLPKFTDNLDFRFLQNNPSSYIGFSLASSIVRMTLGEAGYVTQNNKRSSSKSSSRLGKAKVILAADINDFAKSTKTGSNPNPNNPLIERQNNPKQSKALRNKFSTYFSSKFGFSTSRSGTQQDFSRIQSQPRFSGSDFDGANKRKLFNMKSVADLNALKNNWGKNLKTTGDNFGKQTRNLLSVLKDNAVVMFDGKYFAEMMSKESTGVELLIATQMIEMQGSAVDAILNDDMADLPKSEAIALSVLRSMANIGTAMAMSGNPAVATAGLGLTTLTGIATVGIQIYKIINPDAPLDDLDYQRLSNYKQMIDSKDSGVRMCLLPNSDIKIILPYGNMGDIINGIGKEEDKDRLIIDDSVVSKMIAMYDTDLIYDTKLKIVCPNKGQLRLEQANLSPHMTEETSERDAERVYNIVGITTLLSEFTTLEFSCSGNTPTLTITRENFKKGTLSTIRKAGPGEPIWSKNMTSDVCDKFPFKKFFVTTPGCSYNSNLNSMAYSTCAIMFRKSTWEAKKNRWVLFDPFATFGSNRKVYSFSVQDFREIYPLNPNNNIDDKILCQGYSDQYCKWPEPFVLEDTSECTQKTRMFRLNIHSYQDYKSGGMHGFVMTCPLQATPMILTKENTKISDVEIIDLDKNFNVKLFIPRFPGQKFVTWCQHKYIPKLKSDMVEVVSIPVEAKENLAANTAELFYNMSIQQLPVVSQRGVFSVKGFSVSYKPDPEILSDNIKLIQDYSNPMIITHNAKEKVTTDSVIKTKLFYPSFDSVKLDARTVFRHSVKGDDGILWENIQNGWKSFSAMGALISACDEINGTMESDPIGSFVWNWWDQKKSNDPDIKLEMTDGKLEFTNKRNLRFVESNITSHPNFFSNITGKVANKTQTGSRTYSNVPLTELDSCKFYLDTKDKEFVFECSDYSIKKSLFSKLTKVCITVTTSRDVCNSDDNDVRKRANGKEDHYTSSNLDLDYNNGYMVPKDQSKFYGFQWLTFTGEWCYCGSLYYSEMIRPKNVNHKSGITWVKTIFDEEHNMDSPPYNTNIMFNKNDEIIPWTFFQQLESMEKDYEKLIDLKNHPYFRAINEIPALLNDDVKSLVSINVDANSLQKIKEEQETQITTLKEKILKTSFDILANSILESDFYKKQLSKKYMDCCHFEMKDISSNVTITPLNSFGCLNKNAYFLNEDPNTKIISFADRMETLESLFINTGGSWDVCKNVHFLEFDELKSYESWIDSTADILMENAIDDYLDEFASNVTEFVNTQTSEKLKTELDTIIISD
ncbi:B22R protein [Carp edema virus]|nr:B22R protein [Carp edema virus]